MNVNNQLASMEDLSDSVSRQAAPYEVELDNLAKENKLDDPAQMMKFQRAMGKWSALIELESSIIKTIKDMLASIARKV